MFDLFDEIRSDIILGLAVMNVILIISILVIVSK